MPTITTKDGSSIFYKDWGSGQPLVFSHGWPLNADAWDEQLNFFASRGFRTIAHDRRGHGRSTQTWNGNEMDTYADDLGALVDKLDLKDAIFIGHSTGGGEVTRYLGRHGTKRAKKAVLMSAVPPVMIKSPTLATGIPREAFDDLRKSIATNRSQFYKDFSAPFFGANRAGSTLAQGVRDQFWLQCMTVGTRNSYECIKAFSETDFTEDLKKIDIPVLVLHGDDDQIVPLPISGALSSKLLKKATLTVYQGAPHGLMVTHRDRLHEDLASFIKS